MDLFYICFTPTPHTDSINIKLYAIKPSVALNSFTAMFSVQTNIFL